MVVSPAGRSIEVRLLLTNVDALISASFFGSTTVFMWLFMNACSPMPTTESGITRSSMELP